jgi:hypothetical protein
VTTDEEQQMFDAAQRRLRERQRELGIDPAEFVPLTRTPRAPRPALQPIAPERMLRVVRALPDAEVAERDAADAAALRRESLLPRSLAAWLARAGVGLRMRDEPIDAQLVPDVLRRWAQGFPESLRGASALLTGPSGAGKTCAAVWLLAELYRRGVVVNRGTLEWLVPHVSFQPASELFAACFERDRDRDRRPLERLERVPVLVVDDWGLPFEHAWSLAQLDRLIDKRWTERLPTIVTTNLFPEPLPEPEPGTKPADRRKPINPADTFQVRYPRIYSRLCDAGSGGPGVIRMVRSDMRRSRP